jgi:5-epi-alpha-selinene synthase
VNNIKLPVLYWPFPSAINQHCEAAEPHSIEWLRSFNLVKNESAYKILRVTKFGVLVARAYPTVSLEALKILSDYTFWLAIADDEFEKVGISKQPELLEPVHTQLVDILKGRGASLTDTDSPLVLAFRDIWQRLYQLPNGTSQLMLHFAKNMEDYFQGVRWEAMNNAQGIMADLATYIEMRTFSIATYTCFSLIQITDGIALPLEVIEHPVLKLLELAANTISIYANDIISVAKEMREGNLHNLVLLLQHSYQISLQEAINRATELHDAEVRNFIELAAQLPSFGAEIDADLQRYILNLRFWVGGLLDWYQVTERYRSNQASS